MLAPGKGRRPGQNRRLARWPRWAHAWLDDRQWHAAALAEAGAQAPIRPGERLLAVACGTGGDVVAATEGGLYHRVAQAWTRLGWEQVDRVDWDEQRHFLVLTGLTPAVAARTVLRLAREWDLPAMAAERVGWAKVFDQRISLNRGAGARAVARRRPGEARITWLVILDHGLDPGDPEVRAALHSALTELRALTGLGDAAGSGLGGRSPAPFHHRS